MKSYIKNKYYWLILAGLIIAISACNDVKNPQPEDKETIPDQVVDLLERQFPNAEQTTIKVVEKDRLWEATYSENSENYYVGLDSSNVLAKYKLISPNVPDSVVTAITKFAIRGGVASDFRQNMTASQYEAKYVLRGTEYLLTWLNFAGHGFNMSNYSKFEYKFRSIEKLPQNATAFLRSENMSLLRGSGFVNRNNLQRYDIWASAATPYQFFFSSSGAVVFSEYDLQQVFPAEKDLPSKVLQSIQNNPLFQGFSFVAGMYNKSYNLTLKKGTESFNVFLDDNANIIQLTYTGY